MIGVESANDSRLVRWLERKGHQVLLARDETHGLEVLERDRPDIVLTGSRIERNGSRGLLREIRDSDPGVKVILLTEDGSYEAALGSPSGEAVSCLKETVTPWELCEVVERLMGTEDKKINKECVRTEHKRIVMDNQMDKIWGVVNQLVLCAENVCGKGKTHELGLGLYEIITNAIEHGSLGITFEEKRRAIEENSYGDLLKERLSNPLYSRRRVTIDYEMVPGELRYVVRDEGEGFDWRSLSYSTSADNLLDPCGRGILLARMYLDRVEFNEKGNEVYLVKYGDLKGGNHGTSAKRRKQKDQNP